MKAFTSLTSIIMPLDRANIDTDAIIPKQFLKSIRRSGFGVFLFDEWRYLDRGEPDMDCSNRPLNTDFVINQPQYKKAQILLTRENFGCGSSREHAPWALDDYGFRVIIAPSFADIFYNNCFKNGMLPIVLSKNNLKEIVEYSKRKEIVEINLTKQEIKFGNKIINFEIDSFKKECLLNGLDDISLSLEKSAKIS
ncbi:MAG: 3-isopropylmalate dehydratase small subunit, partial [Methylococcales bacterium]|nr:3-isopropylmalate dehydratase small subunit [Methylococcales bacterium]